MVDIVPNWAPLARWDAALASYLVNRRALGRIYKADEYRLGRLRQYLVDVHARDLDQSHFDGWRKTLRHLHPNTRNMFESTVFKFCRFRRRQDPRCFLPNVNSFARPGPHILPVIVTPAQIAHLLAVTAEMPLPLRRRYLWYPSVMRIAIILLYTAGLRRGELARMRVDDVDLRAGVLRIRESKFHKSRWVPMSLSACNEMRRYLKVRRDTRHGNCPGAPLLFNGKEKMSFYTGAGIRNAIDRLFLLADVCDNDGRRPRIHDMRHSFAVNALLRWYESNADVQSCLPKLALYMGHVSIVSTAYYLRCMPAVLARASERFERSYGYLIEGVSS
jgi:integrase/recombinase XerD